MQQEKRANRLLEARKTCFHITLSNNKRQKNEIASISDSIPNVNLKINEKSLSSTANGNILPIFIKLYDILSLNKDFKDRNWSNNDSLDNVINFLLDSTKKQLSENQSLIFDLNSDSIYLSTNLNGCGAFCPLNWLPELHKKNRKLYKLSIDFLSICFHHLNIPMIKNYDEECIKEKFELLDEYDYEDAEYQHEVFQSYRQIVFYEKKISNTKSNPKEFFDNLNSYNPRNENYKALKDWMMEGVTLYQKGFNYMNYDNYELLSQVMDERPVSPDRYVRFCWSTDDYISQNMFDAIDEEAGNFGAVPLSLVEELTKLENKDISILDDLYSFLLSESFENFYDNF